MLNNQEDSVILNKASVERGMFVTTAYRTMSCEEKKKTNCSFEKIEVPPLKSQNKAMNYSKLGPNGIVKKGVPVYKGDIIVGKTLTKVQKDEQEEKMDFSLAIASGEEGIVDAIWSGPGEDGYLMVKVKIRQMRIPEVGDKCASRSSQKGVCGLLLPQEDMPFTAEGITPDLLMNPHSIPSRMTLSQLTECLYGKLSSLNGKFGDATAFTDQSINPVEGISNMLKAYGFQRYGNEKLFNGFTGEFLDSELFIGPTYYQRLKHMVADKIHCLTTDHDVLTLEGWKPILKVTRDDKVATLDDDGVLVYQCPINTFSYPDYEGSMYTIRTSMVDLKVTGNHRMWVKKTGDSPFEFVMAKDLVGKNMIYKNDALWYPMTGKSELSPAIARLNREKMRGVIQRREHLARCSDKLQQFCLHAGVEYQEKEKEKDKQVKEVESFAEEKCHVVCIEVPNQRFYVRRNGKAVWTGNSRSTGNVTMMHHQPSEGRSREGGLRVGEMERDALISHGGAAFIQETLFDMSDAYQVNVCEQCGNILSSATACRMCKTGQVNRTNIPYCAKLLFQELEAMGIKIQINTK